MIYQWKPGSRIKIPAQAAGERLDYLNKLHGKLTAEIIVKDATPKDSVLHPVFEWNNRVAAHQYRLEQARHLLRSIVVVNPESEKPKPIRAFVVVAEEAEKQEVYIPTMKALQDENYRKQVLARALAELQALRRKYNDLVELAEVFTAIDKVAEQVRKTA